jgi:NtrC-family two-component system response regulator AlgB
LRVIAATNHNLAEAASDGKFRPDLYYRLNVISIMLPPLRARLCDLPHLVQTHLALFAAQSGKKMKQMSPEALEQLRQYDWPGNLRELRNVIERAVILNAGEQIESVDNLPEWSFGSSDVRIGGKVPLTRIEEEHIERVIENSETLLEAARILRVNPSTLYRRRKKGHAT